MRHLLKKVANNIFAVVVSDRYDLAMLFCRVQEFYESPKFINKKFSIWDYFEWYSKKNSGCFSYPKDWSGFNLPIKVAIKCYSLNKIETPYDDLFVKIIKKINNKNGYIIGVDKIGTKTYQHELCHGLYYTNSYYKKQMDDLTKSLSKDIKNKFSKNLKNRGYHVSVINDEIQAYTATEANSVISKGVINIKKIHKQYKDILYSFVK